jgi:antitoxin HigA-1
MIQMRRKPTSPGEILREEFLNPLGMTQKQLADHIHCNVKVINRVINGRSALTATLALKLAAAFKTSPDFWLNAQKAMDIFKASRSLKKLPKALLAR